MAFTVANEQDTVDTEDGINREERNTVLVPLYRSFEAGRKVDIDESLKQ